MGDDVVFVDDALVAGDTSSVVSSFIYLTCNGRSKI
jgi:hypothetical protein